MYVQLDIPIFHGDCASPTCHQQREKGLCDYNSSGGGDLWPYRQSSEKKLKTLGGGN